MSFLSLLTLIKSPVFLWKIITNFHVLKSSFETIRLVIEDMTANKKAMPSCDDSQKLMGAFSDLLKTNLINLPGIDDYEIAVGIDHIRSTFTCSIKDSKTNSSVVIAALPKDTK